jgi:hypothetical protein
MACILYFIPLKHPKNVFGPMLASASLFQVAIVSTTSFNSNWGKLAHHRPLAYHQTLWQIFLNSSPFWVTYNVIGAPSQALQIIFEMQSQRNSQKNTVKKINVFESQNVFFIFFHFEPSYFIIAKLSHFLFKLSDLNCSEIAILRFTNHIVTLKATE